MEPLLQATEISRRYGNFQALRPVTFSLYPGDLVALSGPNGAGKSTLLLCLSGLVGASTGAIHVQGHDLYNDEPGARRSLAYVPDVPAFYPELTAWEHLHFMALAHGAEQNFDTRAEQLLQDFGLWEARDLFPHAYSRGMRLKLGLALALIRPFRVLLLDEPTSALDTGSTTSLAETLSRLRDSGAAVMLTTHDPLFAASLQAKIWQMKDGELFAS